MLKSEVEESNKMPLSSEKSVEESVAEIKGSPSSHLVSDMINQSPDIRILNSVLKTPEPRAMRSDTLSSWPIPTSTSRRHVKNRPEKVLKIPGFQNDFYTNLLAWSSTNFLAIGIFDLDLHKSLVYICDANTGFVQTLVESGFTSRVLGLSWSLDGDYLSIGLDNGCCQIWDVSTFELIRVLRFEDPSPILALSWTPEILATGANNGRILKHDLREKNHVVGEFESHSLSICNLKWRSGGDWLASGGNDNVVKVFDIRMTKPIMKKSSHLSAVKALAWCPWEASLLATGGGKDDHRIHTWNANKGTSAGSVNSLSPVLSLVWSSVHKELISTHGCPKNSFTIWSFPDLAEVADIPAHESRVLESALSPDGLTYCTISPDGDLKFWAPFSSPPAQSRLFSASPRSPTPPTPPGPPFGSRKALHVVSVNRASTNQSD